MPEWITPDWPAPPQVKAAATLRTGGVSEGPFASLNLGSHVGDDPAAVTENRRLLRTSLQLPAEPIWLNQVHGINVIDAGAYRRRENNATSAAGSEDRGTDLTHASAHHAAADAPPTSKIHDRAADASRMVTPTAKTHDPAAHASDPEHRAEDAPAGPATADDQHGAADAAVVGPPTGDASVAVGAGTVCVVMTADCLPVLFCDTRGTRVGAAHAGWRGLAGGVLGATVKALDVPPSQLMAWLGPAIEQDAFEVGDEVREQFLQLDPGNAAAFKPNARGRWQADLYQLARNELARLGVTAVYGGGLQCCSDNKRFFSYRRESRTGRMASLVWLAS